MLLRLGVRLFAFQNRQRRREMKIKSKKKLGPSTTFYTGHDGKQSSQRNIHPLHVSKHAKAKQPKGSTITNAKLLP